MSNKAGTGGTKKNKQGLYAMVEPHAKEVIEKLLHLMRNGDNSNVQMGAAKTLLNKMIPDLRSVEGKIEGELVVGLVLKVPPKNDK